MKRLLCAILLVSAALQPRQGRADRFVPDAEYKPTPRWFHVEVKFGPYKPDVDKEFGGGATPYKDIFGGGLRLMTQLTADLLFLKLHGSLGVGGTFGYFQAKGKALSEDGSKSSDKTTLQFMPFVLSLVYRWDYPIYKWGIPLVPYIRVGLACAAWWITDGSGDTASLGEGEKARGSTFGYQINLGLAFLLDALEQSSAKKLDMDLGINHSYLFVEFVHNRLDDFGSKSSIDLSMKYSLLAGLALEF
ncbi:MAG: MXAN_2562 family outer membrane beta-barrel protein [Polyangia bacterium]|nr:MXAN_2562 family outer membrane beta-barrel protein [Polyangia bacterium]